MLSSKSKTESVAPVSGSKIDTIIGEKTWVEGMLHIQDTTRVDGCIKGETTPDGYPIIGAGGYAGGNVRSGNTLVVGAVQGNISVWEHLEATESGKIIGDITTKSLVIAEDAFSAGKCTMTSLQKVWVGEQKETEKHAMEASRKAPRTK